MEELYHHGILGQKWGVRRTPEQLGYTKKQQKTDMKWVKKNDKYIQKTVKNAVKDEMDEYDKTLRQQYQVRNKNGKTNKNYVTAYNKKLASLMNTALGDLEAPSGKVVRFVAQRGDLGFGVLTALADKGYDMNLVKNGVNANYKVGYKKDVLDTMG